MLLSTVLVEDKPDIRDTVMQNMPALAPIVFIGHADSEDAARQRLKQHERHWQLAIVDLFLAQGSGFGVLKDCRARYLEQKVVVLTSYSEPNIANQCLQLGADRLFNKNSELDGLVEFCRAHAKYLDGKGQALHSEPNKAGLAAAPQCSCFNSGSRMWNMG
jgi:DNA-binding NarL/FixJ family response regulator